MDSKKPPPNATKKSTRPEKKDPEAVSANIEDAKNSPQRETAGRETDFQADRQSGEASPPPKPRSSSKRALVAIFGFLLASVLGLTVLFASGILRFGLSGTSTYILYVITGLLSAVLTFGLLVSTGDVKGQQEGLTIKLGGAVVALAVVTGGGAMYERYFHVPETFSVRLNFFEKDPSDLQKITGTVAVSFGNRRIPEHLNAMDSVRIEGITSDQIGKPFHINLDSQDYAIAPQNALPVITTESPIFVKIVRRSADLNCDGVEVDILIKDAESYTFAPEPNKRNLILSIRLVSYSDHKVELRPRAKVSIARGDDGIPLTSYDFDLPQVEVPPNGGINRILDGLISDQDYAFLQIGKPVLVTLVCANPDKPDQPVREFSSMPSPISDMLAGHKH